MRVSIVTPSFNQGRYISRAIESVKQEATQAEIEHIVLDNCSTDETGALLRGYQQSPGGVDLLVKVRRDSGQTATINQGFRLATGQIVCWLNTDEWYTPGAISQVVRAFEMHPEVDVIFGNCYFTDAGGSVLGQRRETFFSRAMLIYRGCYIPSCATFVRRRPGRPNSELDESFRVAMDWDWYLRLADEGRRFRVIDSPLAYFAWHDSNLSRDQKLQTVAATERRRLQERYAPKWLPPPFRGATFFVNGLVWRVIRVLRNRLWSRIDRRRNVAVRTSG